MEKLNANHNTAMAKREAQKQLVAGLKVEWTSLWCERFNDKVRAEGVSLADYQKLKVNRGTIIHATRSCRTLYFKEILKDNLVENPDRYIQPGSCEGGWNKFIKTQITSTSAPIRKRAESYVPVKPKGSQPKKGGRGWLHLH
ncbi:MAG TPA: hypothetical protein VLL96_02625 [Candidatus Deferrimicrobiaceae bacterium]|nr:hypothetical protein [Candidatus Deferrimicrobiaceae bacterium]